MGLGAVVAVEVGAAVGGADDHVRVVLGDLGALDPLGRLGAPHELDGEVLGQRRCRAWRRWGARPARRRCRRASGRRTSRSRACDTLLTCSTFQCGGGSVGPASGSRLGCSTEPRIGVAERRVAAAGRGARAPSAASVNMRLNCEGALVELGAGGQVEGAVERLRHGHRVHGGAPVGGLVDEALGVVPPGGGGVDLRAGAEALDDHRQPGRQRQVDEQLLVLGGDAADGGAGQVGERAAVGLAGRGGEGPELVERRQPARHRPVGGVEVGGRVGRGEPGGAGVHGLGARSRPSGRPRRRWPRGSGCRRPSRSGGWRSARRRRRR